MAQWVNFDEVKNQVSIKDVLAHYSFMQGSTKRNTKQGVELRIRCPFHEDKTPSLSLTVNTGRFYCFGCRAKGGDILDFVVTKEGMTAGDRTQNRRCAALLIQEWFGVESKPPVPQETTPNADVPAVAVDVEPATEETKEGINQPLKFALKGLDNRHLYLTQERSLAEATIDAFGLGYHGCKGIMHDRVDIPIHNEHGEFVAYAGRSLGEPQRGKGSISFHKRKRELWCLRGAHNVQPQ